MAELRQAQKRKKIIFLTPLLKYVGGPTLA